MEHEVRLWGDQEDGETEGFDKELSCRKARDKQKPISGNMFRYASLSSNGTGWWAKRRGGGGLATSFLGGIPWRTPFLKALGLPGS